MTDYDALVLEYNQHAAAEKAAKAEKDRVGQLLIDNLFADGTTEYVSDDGKLVIQNRVDVRVSREILIANGVELKIVEAATKRSTSDPFVRWYPKGAKTDE